MSAVKPGIVAARIGCLRAAILSGAVELNFVTAMSIGCVSKTSVIGTAAAGSRSEAVPGTGPER